MKAECKIYKGIEYVQFDELPQVQREKLLQRPHHDFIKIMIDGKIVNQCLQYKDYSFWYDKIFIPARVVQVREEVIPDVTDIKADLAVNKY